MSPRGTNESGGGIMITVRILLVEDEPKVSAVIESGLTAEHFGVDVAATGSRALAMVQETAYDLLILDVMLPDMDGFEVCRKVRSLGQNVPILMLSARSLVQDRVRGLNTGADDYLTKPFEFAELDARVRALLRRHREAALTPLVVSDLSLDPVTRIVKRGDRRIDLTVKEFALLEYLMRNAGHVVTRPMIAEQVWDFTWDRLTNVIEVFINHLRKKIELPGEPRLVHAVRGAGYVIREPLPDD
jgi:DNA-binding response OmpR family regulator